MKNESIIIVKRNRVKVVRVEDVLMVERKGRKLYVYTPEEIIDYYENIKNITPLLSEDFFPVLQGCYVNFNHIVDMFNQLIMFDNGTSIMLGATNFTKAKQNFILFLKKEK